MMTSIHNYLKFVVNDKFVWDWLEKHLIVVGVRVEVLYHHDLARLERESTEMNNVKSRDEDLLVEWSREEVKM
jgi:hypothetical protein